MCQPTSKGYVHLIWGSWGSWPKHREAGFAAQKDLCSCKHSISHIALYIPSPIHIYISWLKHKCFFCKDVVVWSEFSSLAEKILKMLILMFSSLHVLLMTVICQHQFKRQPSPGEDSHLWKTRGLCPFLPFSTCLCSSSDHAMPPLCHAFSLMSIITSAWQVMGSHGQDWDMWEKRCKSLLAKVSSASS